MSLNITVNGKFSKFYGKPSILDENERLRKEEFEKRRLERLQQVREESKHLARNIREQVKEEKQRQLRKLEDIKLKEQNFWKHSVLTHKNHGYAASLFQVGAAHRAAQIENNIMAKKFNSDGSYNYFKKQQIERTCNQASYMPQCSCYQSLENNCNRAPNMTTKSCKCRKSSNNTDTCTQTSIDLCGQPNVDVITQISTSYPPTISQNDRQSITSQNNRQNQKTPIENVNKTKQNMYNNNDNTEDINDEEETNNIPKESNECVAVTQNATKVACQRKSKKNNNSPIEDMNVEKETNSMPEARKLASQRNTKRNKNVNDEDEMNSVPKTRDYIAATTQKSKRLASYQNPKKNKNAPVANVNDEETNSVPKTRDDGIAAARNSKKLASRKNSKKHNNSPVRNISDQEETKSMPKARDDDSDRKLAFSKIDKCYCYHNESVELTREQLDDINEEKSKYNFIECPYVSDSDASNLDSVLTISSSNSSSECDQPEKCQKHLQPMYLCQTPAVLFDVETDCQECIFLPCEIKDNHIITNRQFSHVIRLSPRACGKCYCDRAMLDDASKKKNSPPELPSDEKSEQDHAKPSPSSKQNSTQKKLEPVVRKSNTSLPSKEATTKQLNFLQTKTMSKKSNPLITKSRHTLSQHLSSGNIKQTQTTQSISNLTQQNEPERTKSAAASSSKNRTSAPIQNIATQTSKIISGRTSGNKKRTEGNSSTTCPNSSDEQLDRPHFTLITDLIQKQKQTQSKEDDIRISSQDEVTNSTEKKSFDFPPKVSPTNDSSDYVQHFDYNNKYSREYQQPIPTVRSHSRDVTEPTAMENASNEKAHRIEREAQIELLRQRSDERGQKAIEREQVRRDRDELTEKLDAVSRPTQLLPPDAPLLPGHYYTDRAIRNEKKMNTAVEEILLKPAIITCPNVDIPPPSNSQMTQEQQEQQLQNPSVTNRGEVNIGARQTHNDIANEEYNNIPSTSGSCHSLLLGYVNDQGEQIKRDLRKHQTNNLDDADTAKRLKKLLDRVDQIRNCLLEELKMKQKKTNGESGSNDKERDVEQVIDSISDLRKERENILIDEITKGRKTLTNDYANELRLKESIIEQKIREFCQMQKACEQTNNAKAKDVIVSKKAKSYEQHTNADKQQIKKIKIVKSNEEHYVKSDGNKPLEIIIRVQNEAYKPKLEKIISPQKQITDDIAAPAPATIPTDKPIKKPQIVTIVQKSPLNHQDSYDSNSTSYRSLPSVLNQNQPTSKSPEWSERMSRPQQTDINPMIAQYIQRLLTMTRSSIRALSVSSSEIEEQSEIINTPTNLLQTTSDERLKHVESFIEENRSFINELEETIRTQSDMSLETSMRAFEEIWQKRLQNLQTKSKNSSKSILREPNQQDNKIFKRVSINSISTDERPPLRETSTIRKRINAPAGGTTTPTKKSEILPKRAKENRTVLQQTQQQQQRLATADKSSNTQISQVNAQAEIKRFNQLTDNCTTRINELNDLINKVREEKQRLMEITLSSVSDNGRHSTEYLDLPNNNNNKQQKYHDKTICSSSDEICDKLIVDEAENVALEKNKPIGISNDSGIAMSRPVTAMEQNIDADPISIESTTSSQRRATKMKIITTSSQPPPPPTLLRFSPQLLEVNDEPHELSTIMEVDTPITSRINATMPNNDTNTDVNSEPSFRAPIIFPTFEEYVKELNLDLTQLEPQQTSIMHQEFDDLIAVLKEAYENNGLSPKDFPSFNAFLANLSDLESNDGDHTPETIDEILTQMRLANLSVRKFPAQHEHEKHLKRNTPEQDSSSNLTNVEGQLLTSSESESINIEEELRKRNLLRGPFKANSTTKNHKDTDDNDKDKSKNVFYADIKTDAKNYKIFSQMFAAESGVEKLSTSTENLSGDVERELAQMGLQWPTTMRQKKKETMALSASSTTTTTTTTTQSSEDRQTSKTTKQQQKDKIRETHNVSTTQPDSSEDDGRPINLRDFLTRELLKHCNVSSSSSTTPDETIRSQFLQSIIGTISPYCNTPAEVYGGGSAATPGTTLDRQKTSTPVVSQNSTRRNDDGDDSNTRSSTSVSQLFSGESRISSVHFQEGTSVDHEPKKQQKIFKSPKKRSPKK